MSTVLIAGGGFAGVWAAIAAAATRDRHGTDVDIQLVSNSGDLCIRPRLYQGASEDKLVPLAPLCDQIGVKLTVETIDAVGAAYVQTAGGENIGFDRLILATGSQVRIPPIAGAAEHGFVVDTYQSTQTVDAHVAGLGDGETIVVVGAGLTGVEVAVSLKARTGDATRVILIDRNDTPGKALGHGIEGEITTALGQSGVYYMGQTQIDQVAADHVLLDTGERIDTRTVIFATGFRASPLTDMIDAERMADGRLMTDADLRVLGVSRVYAAGDVAVGQADEAHQTLMSCQHAMPMGVAAGRNAVLDLIDQPREPYAQPFYATCVDLGPSGAVFTNGWDRQIVSTGADGAEVKNQINMEWIYPPKAELGREGIYNAIMGG